MLQVSESGKARQISDQEVTCTLYRTAEGAFERKALHVFVQASQDAREFFRIASVELDVATIAAKGGKHVLELDVAGQMYGRTDHKYKVQV